MARGVKGSGKRHKREPCKKCGTNEWRKTHNGRGSSSFHCYLCTAEKARTKSRAKHPAEHMWTMARRRARESGVDFAITVDDIKAIWPTDDVCPALGIKMTRGHGTLHSASPTLDRLNNEWGYVRNNIAIISYAANRAKGDLRARDLLQIARWMHAMGLH